MNNFKDILNSVLQFFPKLFKALFGSKQDKIRNKHLFKRGGYAIALIALVLVGLIVLNVLVEVLNNRVGMEFDLTSDKKNSISEENQEYLKGVDKEINIYVLAASPEEYAGGYMQYYAQQSRISATTSDYYKQTVKLLELYSRLNKNITVKYLDPYGTEMAEINTKYSESYYYGDILVTCSFEQDGKTYDNYRHLGLPDVYSYSDISGGAAYGYDYYYIDGSILETSLTSAIASVMSNETKTVGFITVHSEAKSSEYYKQLLELNNFITEDISGNMLTAIDPKFDAVVICAPKSDFFGSELDILNDFLDNDGKKGKTLLYFGDSGYQNLPNMYAFLDEWGITIEEGILFETQDGYYQQGSPSTLISVAEDNNNGIILGSDVYLTGYNIPMYENENSYEGRTTKTLLATVGGTVCAPMNSGDDFKPTDDYLKASYSTCILSTESEFDADNNPVKSNVLVFSSIDFISQEYATNYSFYKSMAVRAMRVPTGMSEVSITFDTKTIDATSELYIVSGAAVKTILVIFVVLLPVSLIVLSFVIFFRRRNL